MLNSYLTIMRREITYMWRDKGLRYILLLVTLLSLFLFWGTYSAQLLKDIPTAVVDLDRSNASREITDKLKTAENLKITARPGSFAELKELIKQGEVVTGVVIPEDYAKDTALGRHTRIYTVIDGSNFIYATNASTAVLSVTRTVSAEVGIQQLTGSGMQYQQAQEAYRGIQIQQEPWFNPTLNYAFFLVLGWVLNVWQQCCTLASCMIIAGETGMCSWLQIKAAGFSRLKLFTSKSVVHVITFMLLILPVYIIANWVFKIPFNDHFWLLTLFTLVFTISLHSIGALASSVARNSLDATRYGMIIALPSFVLSGYTWPLEAMPQALQVFAKVIPQTWFFQGVNYITFKNPGWEFISHYFIVLAALAAVFYTLAAAITAYRY
ncbi:MAG: ABC transporter permease [Clostridiales bacterium]|nr:ABC transporter permease [Clostridiales bacterium]MCF8023368.1 ABC transporter permease [Clostridiales bacterium]